MRTVRRAVSSEIWPALAGADRQRISSSALTRAFFVVIS